MPINAHPEFLAAEKEYLASEGLENKLKSLEKMISLAPKHKGAENLRAQLKLRYKKLKGQIEKNKKSRKSSGKKGIKKEDMQAAIIGMSNSGKSSLLSMLTNTNPEVTEYKFATKQPVVGMMPYSGFQIQIIEVPAVESENYDKSIVNTADTILMVITSLEQIKKIEEKIGTTRKEKIVIFNKSDMLSETEKRKISSNLQSKKYNFVLVSSKNPDSKSIHELKEKIFRSFGRIRVFTKEPGKSKSERPIVLNRDSTVRDVAEKILHGFSGKVRETKIWGPSSKFAGQTVGLKHRLKDLDVVEFKTR